MRATVLGGTVPALADAWHAELAVLEQGAGRPPEVGSGDAPPFVLPGVEAKKVNGADDVENDEERNDIA